MFTYSGFCLLPGCLCCTVAFATVELLLTLCVSDIWSISSDVIFIKDGSKSTPYFMSQEDSYNISTSHSFCLRHNGTLIILDTPQKFQHVTSLLRQYVTEPEKLYVDAVQKSGQYHFHLCSYHPPTPTPQTKQKKETNKKIDSKKVI